MGIQNKTNSDIFSNTNTPPPTHKSAQSQSLPSLNISVSLLGFPQVRPGVQAGDAGGAEASAAAAAAAPAGGESSAYGTAAAAASAAEASAAAAPAAPAAAAAETAVAAAAAAVRLTPAGRDGQGDEHAQEVHAESEREGVRAESHREAVHAKVMGVLGIWEIVLKAVD